MINTFYNYRIKQELTYRYRLSRKGTLFHYILKRLFTILLRDCSLFYEKRLLNILFKGYGEYKTPKSIFSDWKVNKSSCYRWTTMFTSAWPASTFKSPFSICLFLPIIWTSSSVSKLIITESFRYGAESLPQTHTF